MKTEIWPIGKSRALITAAAVMAFLAPLGCAHRELTAPCSDYKAAAFSAGASPRTIPCDTPQQMQRPPWVIALEAAEAGGRG